MARPSSCLAALGLNGKVAVVNGSNHLAEGSAVALTEAGCNVIVAGRDEFVARTADKARQLKKGIVPVPQEVTSVSEARLVAEVALSRFGRIDILVNSTAVDFVRPFLDTREDEWQAEIHAVLGSVFAACQVMGKVMIGRGRGRIVNIASALATRGLAGCGAYGAAMAGVIELTRVLAIEWASYAIRVNAIGVGWFSDVLPSENDTCEGRLLRYIPVGRRGTPDDIKWLVAYLSSDLCDYVTGQVFFVTGGLLARS